MNKGLKRFFVIIFALFLIYQTDDYFWQRNRERKIEQVIVAMQNSVDEIEKFFRENEDDLEYLVTKCVEDHISIDVVSITASEANPKEIAVEQEALSRRERLIANLPSNIKYCYISPSGIELNNKDVVFGTLHIMISSQPFTTESMYMAGSIGTIELNHTWTINVATYDYPDYVRARKILERMESKQNKN